MMTRSFKNHPAPALGQFFWSIPQGLRPLAFRAECLILWLGHALGMVSHRPTDHPTLDAESLTISLETDTAGLALLEDRIRLHVRDRTPFDIETVEISYSLDPRRWAAANGALKAEIEITPKKAMATLSGDIAPARSQVRAYRLGLIAAIALLAFGPYALQFLAGARVEKALAQIENDTTALRPTAARAAALQRGLLNAQKASDDANALSRTNPSRLLILAEITSALGDSVVLSDLSITGQKVTIAGEAASTSDLIPALSAIPGAQGVAFIGPITVAASGREEFRLSFTKEMRP